MKAIGIVDHDIVPPETLALDGGEIVTIQDYSYKKGLIVVPGYEFSCDTFVDDVHICGYMMDWSDPEIAAEMDLCEKSKTDAYEELCHRLCEIGMPLDWEKDVLNYTFPDGRKASRKPEEVQRKHIFEAIAAKGYTSSWSDAKILVRDNPKLNVRRRKIDPRAAISMIHKCGGIAILAHPYLIDEALETADGAKMTREEYVSELIASGLDGIEASYTYDKTSYKGTKTPEQIEEEVRLKYEDLLCYISGGSDYHADHKKNSKKTRQIGERGISVEEFNLMFGNCFANKK